MKCKTCFEDLKDYEIQNNEVQKLIKEAEIYESLKVKAKAFDVLKTAYIKLCDLLVEENIKLCYL